MLPISLSFFFRDFLAASVFLPRFLIRLIYLIFNEKFTKVKNNHIVIGHQTCHNIRNNKNTESAQPKKREDTYINSEICSSVNFPARTMLSSVCFNRAVDLKCKFLTFLTFKICENYVSPFSNWITSSMLMWSLIPWSLIHFASLDNDFFLLELSWDSGEKLRDHFE